MAINCRWTGERQLTTVEGEQQLTTIRGIKVFLQCEWAKIDVKREIFKKFYLESVGTIQQQPCLLSRNFIFKKF